MSPAKRKPQAREGKNPLEWTVFGVGLALLLATVGALVWDAARGADGPPEPVVTLRMTDDDYAAMMRGELNGQMAFMTGKLKFEGSLPLLMQIGALSA